MRYLFPVLLLILSSCNNESKDASARLDKEMKKHLDPKDSIINVMEQGNTFALQRSEREGIDQERFKEYDYRKEVDTNFFKYVESKTFSNPDEAGGVSTSIEIYKAIKKGETEIRFYKTHYYGNRNPADTGYVKDTAAILYNTYKFSIK